MKFVLGKGEITQIGEIMAVLKETEEAVKEKDWFVSGDEEYFREILQKNGFIITAREEGTGELAGFFSVVFPKEEDYMGEYAGITQKDREYLAYLDTVAVRSRYRGHKLQKKMLEAAERELEKIRNEAGNPCQYRMCSVHPDNCYSLNNMVESGYRIGAEAELYGGLRRYVLWKKAE